MNTSTQSGYYTYTRLKIEMSVYVYTNITIILSEGTLFDIRNGDRVGFL